MILYVKINVKAQKLRATFKLMKVNNCSQVNSQYDGITNKTNFFCYHVWLSTPIAIIDFYITFILTVSHIQKYSVAPSYPKIGTVLLANTIYPSQTQILCLPNTRIKTTTPRGILNEEKESNCQRVSAGDGLPNGIAIYW